ncbi:MAG: pantetheine-phosphate adenylyltransferase [Dehalococcoidales bacterium]|nr:pantetheine-phosphate adenylyltransferase [Dehalococcoidales bacterium]
MTTAIYPGSFDPITNGHLDIIIRASKLFDKLVIGVYDRPDKPLLFTTEERANLVRKSVTDLPNVEVRIFSGLTVNFAREMKAQTIVRGLRMSADFEREFDLAMMNKKLSPDVEIICFMSDLQYQFLSSSLLKEAARLGGEITNMVPKHVAEALRKKVGNQCKN